MNVKYTTTGDKDGIMAGIPIGQVEQFTPSIDDWEQYQERLAQYFVVNGIDAEEKKRAVLLPVIGLRHTRYLLT